MYALILTSHFERAVARFRRAHPDLRQRVAQDLQTDPFQPRLRLHPLRGELAGLHAVDVTHAYRLTLTLQITAREIVLLNIGSHNDVYR